MANTKISALTDGTTAQSTDRLPVARSGSNFYITCDYLNTYLSSSTQVFTNKTLDTASTGNVLKINGTTVSDKTGTGKVVLDTSPTLVTPALGTPTALVLTNATGLPIAGGGTGQSTKAAAFNALSPLTTQGDLLYYNGTTNTRLAPGTAGQVLQTNGAGANPSWTTFTGFIGTSTTSLATVGTGSVVFTTQSGLFYAAGTRIRATSNGTSEYMEGVVTSYVGTTLTVTMDYNSGSGTHADWTINLTGDRGASGVGTGDVVGPASSIDNEIALFNSTTGKLIKRASTTGILKGTSGVLSAATAGTDYADSSFKTIAVSGQSDVVADSATDTLTLVAGTNVTITTNAGTDSITIAASGGGSGSPSAPQGRLTLTTAVPVLTSTVTGATTVYYTPYLGQYVPLYDGTTWTMTDIGGELSQATTDTTKSPAACTTNSNYDIFIWDDSGTKRATRGPAWTSDTARGTGAGTTELQRLNGILTNKNAITNGPAANKGTYVGTIRTNGSSQVDFIYGASGTAAFFGVWNMYNRTAVGTMLNEGTPSWTYSSSTARPLNNTAKARISMVRGVDEDSVAIFLQTYTDTVGAGTAANFGVGLDSTTTMATKMQAGPPATAVIGSYAWNGLPGLGFHFLQQLEFSATNGTAYTAYGQNSLSIFAANLRA